jgi:lysozyme
MNINKNGIDLIKSFESLHDGDLTQIGLQPKMCPAKIWTVGYGRALVNPATRKFLKGDADKAEAYKMYPNITAEEAERMLARDLESFVRAITPMITSKLNDNQFSALVSFSYNLGAASLGKSTLLKKLNANPSDPTIKAEFVKWNKAGGVVLNGLTRRREAEAKLYFS